MPIYYDNTSAISLSKNPIFHYRTKRIEIIQHFSQDHYLKGDFFLDFMHIHDQLIDILLSPLKNMCFMIIGTESAYVILMLYNAYVC